MTKAILVVILLFTIPAAAEQIIPVTRSAEIAATHELRLRNASATDAAIVTLAYDTDGSSAAIPSPIRIEPGEEIILTDVTRSVFGMTAETTGEIRVQTPEQIEVHWRVSDLRSPERAWMPSISSSSELMAAATGRRRRAVCFGCRLDPPTLVKVGDFATFAGSYGVSGTATIIEGNNIRVTGLRNSGTAPGVDLRIGLSTMPRKSFTVLRVTGRQVFQNATLDLTLPPGVDLNSFDTFTVWCYEFNVIIAEGKFKRP